MTDSSLEYMYQNLSEANFLDFYNSFHSVKEFIQFTLNREKPDLQMISSKVSNSNVTAVIPTKSLESDTTKRLLQRLGDINTVVVQSNGPFFNFAFSVNSGIKEAINSDSEFIMLLNDDTIPLHKMHTIEKWIEKNRKVYDIFIPNISRDGSNVSSHQTIYRSSMVTRFILNNMHHIQTSLSNYNVQPRLLLKNIHMNNPQNIINYIILRSSDYKSKKNTMKNSVIETAPRMLNHRLFDIDNIQPVSIIKTKILEIDKLDTAFINGGEDTDLSIRFSLHGYKVAYLPYTFKDIGGASLGKNTQRILKNTIPEILILGYKLKNYYTI